MEKEAKQKLVQKVTVWLDVCLEGIMALVILDKGMVNHKVYIKKVLPLAQKYSNKEFGDNWTFQ